MHNLKYLKYLIIHKWHVVAMRRSAGVSFFRALLHDCSKFLPSEWKYYAAHYYGTGCKLERWNEAWLHHQHRNPHHWEYWLLPTPGKAGLCRPIKMPEKYAREMILDWMATGKAKTKSVDLHSLYVENKSRMLLHADTRDYVESKIAFIIYGD